MEVRQISRNSTDKVVGANLPKGHLNGVLVSMRLKENFTLDQLGNDLRNANIRTKFVHDRAEYLNTNTPLTSMIAMSDLLWGSTGALARIIEGGGLGEDAENPVRALDGGENADPVVVGSKYELMNGSIVFFVDYGSIYCEDGNEFETEIELGGQEAIASVSVYSVSKELIPFHFRKYDIDFDLNEDHKNVAQLYIFTETLEKDANVVVDSMTKQYDSDLEGFRAASQMFGQIENVSTGVLYECFKAMYGVPEDVWVKITKNGAAPLQRDDSRFGILTVRIDFVEDLTTQQNIKNLQRQIQVVSDYERNHRDQAIAMIGSNLMPSSASLKAQLAQLLGSSPVTANSRKGTLSTRSVSSV